MQIFRRDNRIASMTKNSELEDVLSYAAIAIGAIFLGIIIGIQGFSLLLSHEYVCPGQVSEAVTAYEASFPVVQEIMLAVQDECTALLGVICPFGKPECRVCHHLMSITT
jgi:hypothetical protein